MYPPSKRALNVRWWFSLLFSFHLHFSCNQKNTAPQSTFFGFRYLLKTPEGFLIQHGQEWLEFNPNLVSFLFSVKDWKIYQRFPKHFVCLFLTHFELPTESPAHLIASSPVSALVEVITCQNLFVPIVPTPKFRVTHDCINLSSNELLFNTSHWYRFT